MSETSKLETRTLTITQHEQQSLDDYLHDLLLDTAAASMDGQAIVL